MEKLAISVVEAAKLISVSKSTMYALIEQKQIPAVHVGGKRIIIPVKALQEWLSQRTQGGLLENRGSQVEHEVWQ